MDEDKYYITEDDVSKMVNYLTLSKVENVTPELAYKVLEKLYENQKRLEEYDPNAIEAILKDLENY